jgi:hypothetical protein
MQQTLATDYELVCAVADMVSAHGTHDFQASTGVSQTLAQFCGLQVFFENQLPVQITAHDIDVVIGAKVPPQELKDWLVGPGHRMVHVAGNANYTLTFRKGDTSSLAAWQARLLSFVVATTRRVA